MVGMGVPWTSCVGCTSHSLQGALEDREDLVAGSKPGWVGCGDNTGLLKSAPHHLDVGLSVAMCRGDLGVAEPRLDRQEIHFRSQQRHRQSVPQYVRRDRLGRQLRHRPVCDAHCSTDDMRRTESSEPLPAGAHEQGALLMLGDPAFEKQSLDHRGEIVCQWDRALLSALAVKQDLSRSDQMEVCEVYSDRLGDSSSGPGEKQQERVIAAPAGRRAIWCFE